MEETKDSKVLRTIKLYRADVESCSEFAERKKFREVARRMYKGRHEASTTESRDHISVQATWLAIQRIIPKVLNGYNFKPVVVPEAALDYTIEIGSPIRDALRLVPTNEPDANKEARLRTAIVDRAWEISRAHDKLREAVESAALYGEAWLLDGMDANNNPTLDLVSADDVVYDHIAKDPSQARYIRYNVKRTRQEIEMMAPDKADQLADIIDDEKDPNKNYDLECWFVKDLSKETVTEVEVISIDMIPAYIEQGYEVDESKIDPVSMTVSASLSYEQPKYPGGWRHVKLVKDVIIEDGPVYSANGELPIHWLPFYKTPDEFTARGVLDQVIDAQRALDKVVTDTSKYTSDAKSTIISKEGVLQAGSYTETFTGTNIVALIVPADETVSLSESLYQVPPPAPNPLALEQTQYLSNLIENITGSFDLRDPNNSIDPSGEAVEQLESAGHSRLTTVRNTLKIVARQIALNMMANVVAYQDSVMTLDINGQPIRISPSALETAEIERNFDVVIGTAETLPMSGNKRNEAILSYIDKLSSMPPSLAKFALSVMDLPIKDELEMALSEIWDQPPPPPAPDPRLSIFISAYGAALVGAAKDKEMPLEIKLAAIENLRRLAEVTNGVVLDPNVSIPPQDGFGDLGPSPEWAGDMDDAFVDMPGTQTVTPPSIPNVEVGPPEVPRVIEAAVGSPDNPKRFF